MNLNKKFLNSLKKGVLNNKHYTLKPVQSEIKLNQNESPYDIPENLKNEILNRLKKTNWNLYPDFTPDKLYEKTSDYLNLQKENILLGNGSNEMIFTILCATLEKGRKVIINEPTFTIYKLISSNLNADISLISLNKDFSYNIDKILEESKTEGSVTIIATPNNPTGVSMKKNDIIKILDSSNGLVIIDEAYIHFGGESVIDLIDKYNNLIILRTFSKAFGLAGLRIGMMISNPELIVQMSKVKLPYNLNIFTLITLDVMLDNIDYINKHIKTIIENKNELQNELIKIKEIDVIPSDTNFFLVRSNDSEILFDKLLENSILVRDVSSYPMLKNYLRISVGNKTENEKLIRVLNKIYSK